MVRLLDARQERAPKLWFLVFVGLAVALCFPYFEQTRNANERPRLIQGMSLVDRGELAIDGPAARRLDPGPDVARSKSNGRVYPNKPPGASVPIAIAYVGARAVHGDELQLRQYTWWARLLSGGLPTLLLCWFLVARLGRGFGRRPAIAAVAMYAVGTPALSYAHLAYGHQLTALLLAVGIGFIADKLASPRPGSLTRRQLGIAALGGAAAALAVTVEYGAVFAAVPLGGVMMTRVHKHRERLIVGAAVVGAVVPMLALAAYHDAAFGSAVSTGYHNVVNADFAQKHGQGFLGLGLPRAGAFYEHVLSPDGGLLWWAPGCVLGIYGLVRASLSKNEPWSTEARVGVGLWVVYLLVVSGLSFTGGWRVGPRYLVAILPTLALGWAHLISQVRHSPAWMFVVVALAAYGFGLNALAANLWPHFDLTNINSPLREVLLPLWNDGYEPHGVLRSAFSIDAARIVVALTLAGAVWAVVRVIELAPLQIGAVALGVVVGLTSLWLSARVSAHPRGKRNLAYIQRIWEPRPGDPNPAKSARLPPLTEAQKRAQPAARGRP